MNALVVIDPAGAERSEGGDRPHPVVELYGPVVDALRPACFGEERRLRCGILYLRDRAARAEPIACWEAARVLNSIVSLATVHAFASMPTHQLRTLRASLVRMMRVAMSLETDGPRGMVDAT